MSTTLPDKTNGTTGIIDTPTVGQQKTNFGNLRDFIADLFGTSTAALRTVWETFRLHGADTLANASLSFSVGSSALTIALKTRAGSNASATDPVLVGQRSSTAGNGDFNLRAATAATSLVVSSGSTLGLGNSDSTPVYVYLLDNAGTQELAISQKWFGQSGIVSTTAEGGAGAADSATVMYSTTARTNVPFRALAKVTAPQTTAGTWAAVPTSCQLIPFDPPSVSSGLFGQCRLARASSTSLILTPLNGNLLTVNGVACTVPDAGVTLAAAPAAANTNYYIYAVAAAGVITSLEASTTGWSISTTTGNKGTPIKTGDDTRTLVGLARGNGSTQWADSVSERFVLNYWNRRNLDLSAAFTAGRAYASSSWGEINTEIRNAFLTWADEAVNVTASGAVTASVAGSSYSTAIGIDGTTAEDGGVTNNDAAAGQAGSLHPIACGACRTLSEGYHYATLVANHSGASSGTYSGAASGSVRCAVRTLIRG